MEEVEMSAAPACADLHTDPVKEQTVVVGPKGELANVVISIKKEAGQTLKGDVPKPPAVLDQTGCMCQPHLLAMMVGQTVIVKNDDTCMHNVHSLSTDNLPFNIGQPTKNAGEKTAPLKVPETFRIVCDVHPWMKAWFCVFDHPYFSTTKADGTYSIANVPDGTYTFVAWQEKYGQQEQKATVKGGKAVLNFTFKSTEAAMPTGRTGTQARADRSDAQANDEASTVGDKWQATPDRARKRSMADASPVATVASGR
jgi:plastocyanin